MLSFAGITVKVNVQDSRKNIYIFAESIFSSGKQFPGKVDLGQMPKWLSVP